MSQARLEPGEIVVADIHDYTAFDNRSGEYGKRRPAVLLYLQTPRQERRDRRWVVMGLTTLTHYRDGQPRIACPQQTVPDIGPDRSYLWGPATGIPETQIVEHIGWANDALVDAIAALLPHDLQLGQVEDMRPQARSDRRRSAYRRSA